MKYVLDSSVALKFVLPEADSRKAIRLRDDYRKAIHELISRDIFTAEVANGLVSAERSARIKKGESAILLRDIMHNAVFHRSNPLARSGDGNRDQHIVLAETRTGSEVRRWQAHVRYIGPLAFAADGKTLASAGTDWRIQDRRGELRRPCHRGRRQFGGPEPWRRWLLPSTGPDGCRTPRPINTPRRTRRRPDAGYRAKRKACPRHSSDRRPRTQSADDRDAKPRRSRWNSEQRSEVLLGQFMVAPVNAQQHASSLVGK
jgi:hypothetical protein